MTDDSNGSPGLLSNGNFGGFESHTSDNGVHHGWHKVTNSKRQKRQEFRSKGHPASAPEDGKRGAENSIFRSLEKEAEERRARREALLLAAAANHTIGSAGNAQSESDVEGDEDHQADTNGASNGELKKLKIKKPKKPKVSVAEAASAIDPSDLASFLMEISESFSELPDVQLMRFADYFGRAFNAITPSQFGWNKILKESSMAKAAEIPLCYLPESVNKIASDWLFARPVDALGDFIIWALNDVLNDVQPQHGIHKNFKGAFNHVAAKTKVAVLLVLALALRKRPEAFFQKAVSVRPSPQFQGQEKLAMLAWAYGQAAQGDLIIGMQLWVQNLLPLACGKTSTPVSRDIGLQFAESILFANSKKNRAILQSGASRKGDRLVPPVALDLLMRVSFPSDAARTKATERFLGIYPLVKELALAGPHRSKVTKPVAQQLLPLSLEAASEDVPALVHEACDVFIWCLSQNTDCIKQWEKLHLENLNGSVQALSYISSEWKEIAGRLSALDDFRNTVSGIRVKNHAALGREKTDMELYKMLKSADKHCKMLDKRLARPRICFKLTATLIAGVGIAYGLYLLNPDIGMSS